MEYGIYIHGGYISSGVQETENAAGGKEIKRYVLVSTGGVQQNSVPRIKMTDTAWSALMKADCSLGDDVILKVRPFAAEGKLYYTADTFAVSDS